MITFLTITKIINTYTRGKGKGRGAEFNHYLDWVSK